MAKKNCTLCLKSYSQKQIDKNLVNTLNHENIFQCNRCFHIDMPIKIYNIYLPCGICMRNDKERLMSNNCGHNVCKKCYDNDKFSKIKCCMCNCITKYLPINLNDKYDYFKNNELKIYFKRLYVIINDTIGYYIDIKKNRNLLYKLLVEYHKWLLLLKINDNNNNINKLSPSLLIDKVWHEHILDTVNYSNLCDKLYGHYMHHYPTNSFLCNYNQRMENYNNTIKLYKLHFGNIDTSNKIWENEKIYIKTDEWINCKYDDEIFKVPLYDTMIFDDLKQIIGNIIHYKPDELRLIYAGIQLPENGNVKDYAHHNGTIFIILRLRGC